MTATASRRAKITVTVFAIAVTLIVLEIAARLIDPRFPMVVRDANYGSTGNPLHPEIDRNGFRNKDAADGACLVLLGDSQIFGDNVPYEVTAPRLLDRKFGIPTYSMAMPGHGPLHQLARLDAVIARSPKVVITPLYFGNDIYDVYSFWASQRGRNATLRIPELETAEARTASDILAAWRKGVANTRGRPRRAELVSLRFLTEIARTFFAVAYDPDLRRLEGSGREAHGSLPETETFFLNDDTYRDIFQNEARLAVLDLEDARLAAALAASGTILSRINRRLAAAGVAHVVLLLPTKERVFAAYLGARDIAPNESYRRLLAFENTARKTVIAALRKHAIPFLDALAVWEKSVLDGKSPHLVADGHPNAHGHALLARLIAESEVRKSCTAR